jgi:predicted ferric reductase
MNKNTRTLIIVILSYLPSLLIFGDGFGLLSFVKLFANLAFISFFWLIITGFREGFMRGAFTPNFLNKFHKTLGPLAYAFVLIHILGNISIYRTPLIIIPFAHRFGQYISFGAIAFIILTVTVLTSYWLRKKHYQQWKLIHHLNYLMFGIVSVHAVLSSTIITPLGAFRGLLFSIAIIAAVIKLLYDFKFFSKIYTIKSLTQVGTETFNVTIDVSAEASKNWLPGQYVALSFSRIASNHPFSISRINSDGSIDVTFKLFGKFTRRLATLKAGDKLYVAGAYGEISSGLAELKAPLVFVAGGIGITPFRAILHRLLEQKDTRELYLFYGVRDSGFLAFNDEFKALAAAHPNFHYVPVLEKEELPGAKSGFIGLPLLQETVSNWNSATFFVCGPPVMMKIITNKLSSVGITPGRIRSENFGY